MGQQALTFGHHYQYSISSTNDSSAKYGNCEVCNKPASEVYHQTEQRSYSRGYTYHGCNSSLYGHKDCLVNKRR